MTQEEKAKAYDEALEQAKKELKTCGSMDCDAARQIFRFFPQLREGQENDVIDIPFGAHDSELKGWEYTIPEGMEAIIKDGKVIVREKESEDEDIRKDIIEYLKLVGKGDGDYAQPMINKWIAYLEKQKESLHIPETCKENADSFTDSVIEVRSFQRGLEEGRRQEQEKQKEQKQTENEREYVKTLKGLVSDFIRDAGGGITDVAYYQKICDWLEGRHVEQKPAEWDKFDEDCLKRAIWYVENPAPSVVKDTNLALWLKFLPERFNLQPKQECGERGAEGPQEIGEWRGDEGVCKKQKEQKPAGFYVTLNGEKYYAEEVRCDGMNVKVVAPKPAEWSEEDNEMLKDTIRAFYLAYPYALDDENPRKKNIDWLNFLPERFNLYPKQGWGEEDENAIATAIRACRYMTENFENSTKQYEDAIKRLKSLRPQPREEIYQSAKHDLAIRFMNHLDENRPKGKMGLSNGECEDIDKAFKENDWAKIMRYVEKYRPSWKPSEKQIRALERAIIRAHSEDEIPILTELRQQLKKLM